MSKYIKLEDAIHAIAENMAQEANLKEHCNEPTFCAGEFLVEAEMSVKDLPTIEFICEQIAKDFGEPCSFSPTNKIMLNNCKCREDCGDIPIRECWKRYFEVMQRRAEQ